MKPQPFAKIFLHWFIFQELKIMKKSKKLFPVSNISFSSNCEENAQQKTSLGC